MREQFFATLRAFVEAPGFDEILTRLAEHGWVGHGEDTRPESMEFQLTEEGRRKHEEILFDQKEVRQRVMQGIGEEEHSTVIRILQRILKIWRERPSESNMDF